MHSSIGGLGRPVSWDGCRCYPLLCRKQCVLSEVNADTLGAKADGNRISENFCRIIFCRRRSVPKTCDSDRVLLGRFCDSRQQPVTVRSVRTRCCDSQRCKSEELRLLCMNSFFMH